MAELVGISYTSVVKAALIPSVCFVFGIAAGVYCLAGRYGLGRLPARLVPEFKELLKPGEVLGTIIPMGLLIYLLLSYFQPERCGAWTMISAIAIFLIFGSWKRSELLVSIKGIFKAFHTGVTGPLVMLVVMMSCVQVVVAIINATGFGIMISDFIMDIAGGVRFYALIGVMIVAIILGMGMSTTAAYVVAAAALMPVMQMLDMPLLATHLFVFYFAIAAAITPPVCVAVFTAQAISGGSWLRIAVVAMGLSLGGYIVPYYFIYQPAFLMEGAGLELLRLIIGCIVAIFFIEVAAFGYLKRSATWVERLLFLAGGFFLMSSSVATDIIGSAIILAALASHLYLPELPLVGKRRPQIAFIDPETSGVDEEEVKTILDRGEASIAES